jgi:hypothetical protein
VGPYTGGEETKDPDSGRMGRIIPMASWNEYIEDGEMVGLDYNGESLCLYLGVVRFERGWP